MSLIMAFWVSSSKPLNHGSTILMQMDVRERISAVAGKNSAQSVLATQSSTTLRLARQRFSVAAQPPIASTHFRASRQSSTANKDGVLMVSPLNKPSFNSDFLVMRKILGKARSGLKLVKRVTARGERTNIP